MRWVARNGAAFGGNASRLTIFGESAGGCSVGLHMLVPKSKGLFQAAIIESGPISLTSAQPYDEAVSKFTGPSWC